MQNPSKLPDILQRHQEWVLSEWISRQISALTRRPDLQNEAEIRRDSVQLLAPFVRATRDGGDIDAPEWADVKNVLANIAKTRARKGFTPSETATFVFSLKEPVFSVLRKEVAAGDGLADETWAATVLIDKLGLYTMEMYQQDREDVIRRQQQELLELSTPVVRLWRGILALPLIGTLDSARTQVVMESLLSEIVATESSIAIIDITGVPTVDTLVAQHLLKTVAAARLMGAECIISGIRPQIAQTIVHLGVDLGDVVTKASLADAFRVALHNTGMTVVPRRQGNEG